METRETAGGTVVAGVDVTDDARAALAFALAEAAARHGRVRAVWVLPHRAGPSGVRTCVDPPSGTELTVLAEVLVRSMLDDVLAAAPSLAAVPVTVSAEAGDPAAVLVRESAGVALLVVGQHNRSVTSRLVRDAACPVTVVAAGAPGHDPVRDRVAAR